MVDNNKKAMRGRMPFPIPFLPATLVVVVLALIVPLCFRWSGQEISPKVENDSSKVAVLNRVSVAQVHGYLREEGVIDERSKIISTEWMDTEKQWLVITEQGKHDDGEPKFGHWFVDAECKDWSGSFCRH